VFAYEESGYLFCQEIKHWELFTLPNFYETVLKHTQHGDHSNFFCEHH
jgi:hypothetical protein